jgi:hypothetical protein
MKTQKPLKDLIPAIMQQFYKYKDQLQFDLDLYKLHEGQVRTYVTASLSVEMLSTSAFKRAAQRIPSINIPRKVTDKLSKVYAESPIRFASKDLDLIQKFTNTMNLNGVMDQSNHMSNLHNRCAIEIYVEEGAQRARVLNAQQFFVFSDSITSPNIPTVFVKLLGKKPQAITQQLVTKRDGTRVTNEDEITFVDVFAVYTDTEFMVMDSDGIMRDDLMQEMGITSTKNPFGVIPFVYVNKSHSEIIPYPNQTMFDMGILIPKLLTDLNYSAQFLSHSVIWTKNAELQGAEINPDAIVDLGDTDGNGNDPEIGTIEPKTDIDGILNLVSYQLGAFLSTVGLKSGTMGGLEVSNAASGISKVIDESDTTEARRQQMELFRLVEKDFWFKFSTMQGVWSTTGMVDDKEKFSPEFLDSFHIKYAEIKPLETEKSKYEKMKIGRELKLITKRRALQELYPNLTEEQLDIRVKELDEEGAKEKEEMFSMGLTPGFSQLDRQQQGKSDDKLAEDASGGTEPE